MKHLLNLKYFVSRPRKDGTARYFWQPGKHLQKAGWALIRLPDDLDMAREECDVLNRQVDQWRAGELDSPAKAAQGTMRALIHHFQNSGDYARLANISQAKYDLYLKIIDEWAGDTRAVLITAKMVQDLYEEIRIHKSRKAAYIVQTLRMLYNYAGRQSLIPNNYNPARKPRIRYKAERGHIWREQDVTFWTQTADALGLHEIGTAITLNYWIGQRNADIYNLPEAAFDGETCVIVQSKTKAEAIIPVEDLPPHVLARIAAQKRRNADQPNPHALLLPRGNGDRYVIHTFADAVDLVRQEVIKQKNDPAEQEHARALQFRHLRHTAVTGMGENGATPQEIAGITGHSLKQITNILNTYNIRTRAASSSALRKRKAGANH